MTNAVQFAAELSRFGSKIDADALTLKRAVSLQLLRGVVLGTPVGNPDLWQRPAPKGYVGGHARASWQVTHGAPAASEVEGTDASGNATLSAGSQEIADADLERTTWITSNLPYIGPLEFEGHSSQAPEGWVLAHVERVKAQFP
jgi:hypothetical protein